MSKNQTNPKKFDKTKVLAAFILLPTLFVIAACGGSSDKNSDLRTIALKGRIEKEDANPNGSRDPIVNYKVCSFRACSRTSFSGDFVISPTIPKESDKVDFDVTGENNFVASVAIPLRSTTKEVKVTFLKPDDEPNELEIGEVLYDGVLDPTISDPKFNDGD